MSKSILTFAIGAGLGAAIAWFTAKTKYEKITQEEIESVKEVYRNKYDNQNSAEASDEKEEEIIEEDDEMSEYEEKAAEYSGETHKNTAISPYIITMGEFGEDEEYDSEALYYYSDSVLADADDNIIEDVRNTIGDEAIKHIDDGEDSVYVRNERLAMDYEVVVMPRTYEEAARPRRPYMED